MEKIRQVDEDKVRKRATERDAIRNVSEMAGQSCS